VNAAIVPDARLTEETIFLIVLTALPVKARLQLNGTAKRISMRPLNDHGEVNGFPDDIRLYTLKKQL